MIERIGPSSPSPDRKKTTPNSKLFREKIEEVRKIEEPELDKQKKRFFKLEEETESPKESTHAEPSKTYQEPSPYKTSYPSKEREKKTKEDLPKSPNFYDRARLKKRALAKEKKENEEIQLSPKEKERKEKKEPTEKEELLLYSSLPLQKEERLDFEENPSVVSKEQTEELLEELPAFEKKEFEKAPKKEEAKPLSFFERERKEEISKKAPFFEPQEKKPKKIEAEEKESVEEKPLPKKEEKIKKKEGEKEPIFAKKEILPQIKETPSVLKDLPADIQSMASASAASVAPYIRPENLPLFERMVGTLLQMTKSGVEISEIQLNAASFVGSKYYGTKIIFEKYGSAPDSFNIHLTGPDEAVTLFNENLDGLYKAFESGNFSFRIGRLWAEYETERPLFRRKSDIGKEGKEERREQ
jgi:hypothetical protein